MVRLIPAVTGGLEFSGQIKVSAQAAVSRSKFSGLEALCSRMAKRPFNQLEIVLDSLPSRSGEAVGRITSLCGIFSPSPTSALWLPTKDWKIDADRGSRDKYLTAKTKEDVLDFHRIAEKPSVFELHLEISTKMAKERVLDRYADAFVRIIPESIEKLHLFGCCDVVEPVVIPQLKTSVLMPERFQIMMNIKPPAYPELGDRFEALHSLMFGSRRLCEGLSSALGEQAKLITSSNALDFAVVRLASICNKESASELAANWLIAGPDKLAGA